MKSNKILARKLDKAVAAWETLRPNKSFGGMTFQQFTQKVKPSRDSRTQVDNVNGQLTEARSTRTRSDAASNATLLLVVNAIKGDPEEGEDGALYAAMGYVPKSARRSGLTRRGSATPSAPSAAAN